MEQELERQEGGKQRGNISTVVHVHLAQDKLRMLAPNLIQAPVKESKKAGYRTSECMSCRDTVAELKTSSKERASRTKMRSPAPIQKVLQCFQTYKRKQCNFSKVAEGCFIGSLGCLRTKQ